MHTIPIFSNFLSLDKLSINEQSVIDQCDTLLGNSDQYYFDRIDGEIGVLSGLVRTGFNKILKQTLGVGDNYTIRLCDSWINRGSTKNIVEPHQHACKLLSAVYYADVVDGSELKFITPIPIIADKIPQSPRDNIVENFNCYNSSTWTIKCEKGMVVYFPSWLYHYVVNENKDRLSIAFNGVLHFDNSPIRRIDD